MHIRVQTNHHSIVRCENEAARHQKQHSGPSDVYVARKTSRMFSLLQC